MSTAENTAVLIFLYKCARRNKIPRARSVAKHKSIFAFVEYKLYKICLSEHFVGYYVVIPDFILRFVKAYSVSGGFFL